MRLLHLADLTAKVPDCLGPSQHLHVRDVLGVANKMAGRNVLDALTVQSILCPILLP